MFSLQGKNALITGGTRGIGRATAELFARAGADLALGFLSNRAAAAAAARQIETLGRRVETFACDLTDWEAAAALPRRAADALGALDIVVNNAGVWLPTPVDTWTRAAADRVLLPNLYGVLAVTRGAAEVMREQSGGAIIHVASTAGQRGEPGYGIYAAAKGAVIALTKSLAPELAPAGIRVNCVAPGWVRTDMSKEALARMSKADLEAEVPLGRAAEPAEIAACILFLAGAESSFVTGEVLNVNGGAVLCG